MHPETKVFALDIPVNDPEKMEEFNKVMVKYQDAVVEHVTKLAKELGVREGTAQNIWYLRSRSRWSQNLEDRIIKADQAGISINPMHPELTEEEQLKKAGF